MGMMGTIMATVMTTRQSISAAITLMLFATILPEMLSGNTPVDMMVKPATFLFFLAAYGLPVLCIREFAVRRNLGFIGLFLLGLSYGIVNEALLAKSLFRDTGVPVDVYESYGFSFGIQWAWAAFILPWHAVASTMLPIAFAHQALPQVANAPWLGKRLTQALAFLLFILISVFYLYEDTSALPRSPLMLGQLWAAIAALAFLSTVFPAKRIQVPPVFSRWRQAALGFSGIVPFLSFLAVAHFRWPLTGYFAVMAGWLALYRLATRWFADVDVAAFGWFGLGWYMQIGVFSWLGIAAQYPMVVVADCVAFAILWSILQRADRVKA